MFWIRYKDTENGAYTEFSLRPGPTDVDYPERRAFKTHVTVDGNTVVQRALRDPRARRWVWKRYNPRIAPYESQWKDKLEKMEYRYRIENNLYPIIEVWEDESGVGGFDKLNGDQTRKYTKVKVLQVQRTPQKGGGLVVYDDSTFEFVLADDSYTAF